MATPRSTRNNASGTLGAGYTAGDGSFTLTTGHGARFAGSKWPIYVTAVESPGPGETVKGVFSVTGVSGDTLQGVLAADGTTDVNVANGATIECRPTRQHIDDLIDACTGSLAATGGTASGIAVTSSTINSTPIGGTTPAAGSFTTLAGTGNASLGGCFTVTASGGAVVNVTSNMSSVIFDASASVFRITSSSAIFLNGKVGVGTGNPLRGLHVSGASSSESVEILLSDTDQIANSRNWAVGMSGTQFVLRAAQDTPGFGTTILAVNRNGSASLTGSLTAGGLGINTSSGVIFAVLPGNYANDAAAAIGGVGVGGVYRNGSVLQVRVS